MKKVIPAILLFIFFHSISVAQTVNERIQIVETNDLFYACKIQVAISKDSASLGNAVSRFHYNPDIISFPENPKIVFHNFYDGDYRSSVSHPSPGTVSLNIVNLGGSGAKVSEEFVDFATIHFNINSPVYGDGLKRGLQQFFAPFSTSIWDIGSLSISSL
ncbi:MAG: hypothetical protein KAI45_13650, partial [Melioribacteraceae bacterium]|nr:hypothetical protein [Melioribacteraceae bacterium]